MNRIPLGLWIQELVIKFTDRFDTHFRWFSHQLTDLMTLIIQGLMYPHPIVIILILSVLAFFLSRSWKNSVTSALGFLLILNLGYWQETMETLTLVFFSTVICTTIGVPVGILCAHRKPIYRIVQPVLDLMQTIPTFVYLIPTLILFGLGLAPGVISTVIFSMPAPIRLTYLGIKSVPQPLIELSNAFGSTRWQRLFKVEIPYAMPSIRAGVSQCVMLSLSMVVISALVGADGLGKVVVQSLNTVNIAKGFESGLVIVITAIFLDRLLLSRGTQNGS